MEAQPLLLVATEAAVVVVAEQILALRLRAELEQEAKAVMAPQATMHQQPEWVVAVVVHLPMVYRLQLALPLMVALVCHLPSREAQLPEEEVVVAVSTNAPMALTRAAVVMEAVALGLTWEELVRRVQPIQAAVAGVVLLVELQVRRLAETEARGLSLFAP